MLSAGEKSSKVSTAQVEDLLGQPLFRKQKPRRGVGVVNGLAWTSLGGTTLAVECSVVFSGSRGLKQTGQLGDVMKESAQIAYSYISSNLVDFGAEEGFFDESTIHIHVPEGATPKDGPSAGITMASALLSLATGKPLLKNVAMTGELTLTGNVLPVGGIREKVIAARRANINEVILPYENKRDYDELPEHVKENVSVRFAASFPEVANTLFS